MMPVHRRGHDRLPDSARQRDVINRWNDVGQFVPGKRRKQTQGWPMGFHRDLDKVVVNWPAVGATVQTMPDSFHRARGKHLLKPAARNAAPLSFTGGERGRQIVASDPDHLLACT